MAVPTTVDHHCHSSSFHVNTSVTIHTMSNKESVAHKYFTIVRWRNPASGRWEQKRQCTPCNVAGVAKLYTISSSTDTLCKHLSKTHPTIFAPRSQPAMSSASVSSKRQRTDSQSTIQRSFVKQNNVAVRPAFAELFASCSLPHSLIESPLFIAALSAYRQGDDALPTAARLRHDILDHAQRMRAAVISQLKGYCRSYPLTIAIDGWTNVRQDKVTNVLVLCGGVAFYWCSIVNVSDRNTAVWMHDPVRKVLLDIKQEGLIFSALVADNEQVNKTLHHFLLASFPFLIRSPCAAHLVQLCVNHALSLPAIEPILTGMEELLRSFRYKEHRLKLKQVQLAASDNKSYLCLIKPCDTRWSSHLAAARRLLKLRVFVDTVLQQAPQFWVQLAEVVRFLEPFATATNVVQADRSTLFDFYTQFKAILKHVKDTPPASAFHPAKDSITNVIIGVWEKHVCWDAIIITAALSFDPTVDDAFPDKLSAARRWFTEWAAEYAVYWTLSAATTVVDARSTATHEWSQYVSRSPGSCFSQLDADVAEIRASHALQNKPFDPKAVWALYLDDAPVLAHAAVALLSIAGSEAAVERSFSAQGTTHSDRRNRLRDEIVEAEMFIKFNRLALQRAGGAGPGCGDEVREMTDEFEDDSNASFVAELFRMIEPPEQQQQQERQLQQKQQQNDSDLDELPAEPIAVRSVPRPPPSADDLQRFITEYVRDHTITARFRWQPHHEQQLQAAAVGFNPPMRDVVSVLKKKVMAYVRGLAEQEAAGADVSVIG